MLVYLITLLAAAQNPNQSSITTPSTTSGSQPWFSCLARDATGKIIQGDIATIDCFKVIFQRFVYAAFMLAGITAVIMIAYAGAQMVLSSGDAKKQDSAKHIITYAVIGLLIIFLAAFIVSTIAYIMGVPCIGNMVPGFTNCADKP